jgi:hypothetical protein
MFWHLLRQQPRNQYIRAEDDHEAARDHAAVGKIDDEPATGKEKEADSAYGFKANEHISASSANQVERQRLACNEQQ